MIKWAYEIEFRCFPSFNLPSHCYSNCLASLFLIVWLLFYLLFLIKKKYPSIIECEIDDAHQHQHACIPGSFESVWLIISNIRKWAHSFSSSSSLYFFFSRYLLLELVSTRTHQFKLEYISVFWFPSLSFFSKEENIFTMLDVKKKSDNRIFLLYQWRKSHLCIRRIGFGSMHRIV
jgi:hypothetical protein